jgi:hypothetical protein
MSRSSVLLRAVVVTIAFASLACAGTDSSSSDTGSSYGSGGSGSGSYDYTYTCATGTSYTVPVPMDGCEDASEYYAEVFGCNEVDLFYDACVQYYNCYGADTSDCSYYLR